MAVIYATLIVKGKKTLDQVPALIRKQDVYKRQGLRWSWMADYVQKLRDDLVEQFKGKPVIDALMEAVGDELNEVRQFYEDLRDKRNIQTAVGKQLDGIGDNAVLTRLEAGALACAKESVYVLDDDAYRTRCV